MVMFSTLELSRGRFGHASAQSFMMHDGLLMHEGRGLRAATLSLQQELKLGPSPLFFTSRLILRCMRPVPACTSVDSYCILLVD